MVVAAMCLERHTVQAPMNEYPFKQDWNKEDNYACLGVLCTCVHSPQRNIDDIRHPGSQTYQKRTQ